MTPVGGAWFTAGVATGVGWSRLPDKYAEGSPASDGSAGPPSPLSGRVASGVGEQAEGGQERDGKKDHAGDERRHSDRHPNLLGSAFQQLDGAPVEIAAGLAGLGADEPAQVAALGRDHEDVNEAVEGVDFDVCSNAWGSLIRHSLPSLITTGEGHGFK